MRLGASMQNFNEKPFLAGATQLHQGNAWVEISYELRRVKTGLTSRFFLTSPIFRANIIFPHHPFHLFLVHVTTLSQHFSSPPPPSFSASCSQSPTMCDFSHRRPHVEGQFACLATDVKLDTFTISLCHSLSLCPSLSFPIFHSKATRPIDRDHRKLNDC